MKTLPLKLVALLLLMWLGMLAYWMFVPHRWQAPTPQAAAAGLTAATELPHTVFTASDYAEQLLRPVFVPGRRPVAIAAETVSPDAPVNMRYWACMARLRREGFWSALKMVFVVWRSARPCRA